MSPAVAEAIDSGEAQLRRASRGSSIVYYCVVHRVWAEDRSPITRYRDRWAFCVNGCTGTHDWRRIAPVSFTNLRVFGPTFLDRDDLTT
jgi:hypothetical protein